MRRGDGMLLFFLGLMAFAAFVMFYAHKDDDSERAECEARGGTFVEARSPLHVCVKELKP